MFNCAILLFPKTAFLIAIRINYFILQPDKWIADDVYKAPVLVVELADQLHQFFHIMEIFVFVNFFVGARNNRNEEVQQRKCNKHIAKRMDYGLYHRNILTFFGQVRSVAEDDVCGVEQRGVETRDVR